MFDIGFWEIAMVGVVALLVIGPKELPAMMRTIGTWMGKTRHFVNAVKTEIEREGYRADELKRLLAEQTEIVERHKNIDPTKPAVPVNSAATQDDSRAASAPVFVARVPPESGVTSPDASASPSVNSTSSASPATSKAAQ